MDTCPNCGRPNFSPFKSDFYQIKLDEQEDIINFNEYTNNIFNINLYTKLHWNISEPKITCVNNNYSIERLNSFSLNEKNSTNKKIIDNVEFKINSNKARSKGNLGRKTKRKNTSTLEEDNTINDNMSKKVHNGFSDDNMRKKSKNLIQKYILEFINDKIKIKYNNDIGYGNSEKNLKFLSQKEKKKSKLDLERQFMNKKLNDIFSQDISERFRNYNFDHNKNIIASLINEKDEDKKTYFNNLFNLTFSDCLNYFIGKIDKEELKGFKTLESEKQNLLQKYGKEGGDYLADYIKNYENRLNKRNKKSGKKSEEK